MCDCHSFQAGDDPRRGLNVDSLLYLCDTVNEKCPKTSR